MTDLGLAIIAAVVILAIVLLVILFRTSWRVAEPDEALIETRDVT